MGRRVVIVGDGGLVEGGGWGEIELGEWIRSEVGIWPDGGCGLV